MTITVPLRSLAETAAWLLAHRAQRVTLTQRPDGTVLGHLWVED